MTASLKDSFTYTNGIEELIFANRNKTYGAYVLRRNYSRNLMIAFWFAVTVFTGAVSAPLLLRSHSAAESLIKVTRGNVFLDALQMPSVNKTLSMEELTKLIPKVSTFKYVVPIVAPDERVIEDYDLNVDMLKEAMPGLTTRKGNENGFDVTLVDPLESPANKEVIKDNTDENREFNWAEEMPRFSEGEDALLEFLSANINYPELARRVGIEGKVIVNFTVEKSGDIGNIKIVKSIGGGCDEEALRVIKLTAGRWIAGKQNGKAVKVNISIPIVFRLH